MDDHASPPPGGHRSEGRHLATVGYEGRFWDVYLELDDDPSRPTTCRAFLRFSPAGGEESEQAVETATILIEPSYEEVLAKARNFQEYQLVALLRSALPD